MAIVANNIWDFRTEIFEKVFLWERFFTIARYTANTGLDALSFIECDETKCPKCNTGFNPPPAHGDDLTCVKCKATFHFAGAMHPKPIGETRIEVEKALKWR